MMTFDLTAYLQKNRKIIDAYLDQHLPPATTRPAVLHEAMRYSVFSGGKRLRPILCLSAVAALGGDIEKALRPACAIELLHTFTLIHDDLPAMDDDDLRRGKPTCHIKFGEANAILAGDALIALCFEWVTEYPVIAQELAQAVGSQGIMAGQVEDLAAEGVNPNEELLTYIHLHKTARLFQASMRTGAYLANASHTELSIVSDYGEKLGVAFQLIDDIQDENEDEQLTAIKVYGREEALKRAHQYIDSAKEQLQKLSGNIQPLVALADFVVERKN